jgi:ubiquinone/menaquinone biosynthesis C-methylase UbiE
MPDNEIRFDDGKAYERYMGKWSQLAGDAFLNWLAPGSNLRWLDVGCGNGAFTETIVQRHAPAQVHGIDPSEAQLAFARTRPALRNAYFRQANAMALPFDDNSFDAAVMPLVIFFVPDPAQGVAEMTRVVAPGGIVAAYAWDLPGGGFPYEPVWAQMRAIGAAIPQPPSPGASSIDAMQNLWEAAGLDAVETRAIHVERTFADFEDYWATILGGPSVSKGLTSMPPDDLTKIKTHLRAALPPNATGQITCTARAHAAKGRVRD